MYLYYAIIYYKYQFVMDRKNIFFKIEFVPKTFYSDFQVGHFSKRED